MTPWQLNWLMCANCERTPVTLHRKKGQCVFKTVVSPGKMCENQFSFTKHALAKRPDIISHQTRQDLLIKILLSLA